MCLVPPPCRINSVMRGLTHTTTTDQAQGTTYNNRPTVRSHLVHELDGGPPVPRPCARLHGAVVAPRCGPEALDAPLQVRRRPHPPQHLAGVGNVPVLCASLFCEGLHVAREGEGGGAYTGGHNSAEPSLTRWRIRQPHAERAPTQEALISARGTFNIFSLG